MNGAGFDSHDPASRLALALDTSTLAEARAWVEQLRPYFGWVKIGLELYTAAGPGAVEEFKGQGLRVFLDIKLHDIPNTVAKAAASASALGVDLLTVHTSGGYEMLAGAVQGFGRPGILGVTVLTSDEPDDQLFATRLGLAKRAGCFGVVCSAAELDRVRGEFADLFTVVPGIRLAGSDPGDQVRVSTPGQAVLSGADLLVIGRTVTAAPDPQRAGAAVFEEVSSRVPQR